MKRILFLGNGFDLAHDLPTRYTDFLYVCKKYINESFEYDNKDYSKTMEAVLSLYIGKYGDQYKEMVKNNSWIKHFVKRFKEIGENWIDFEREILAVCNSRILLSQIAEGKSEIFDNCYDFIDFKKNEFDFKKTKEHLNQLIVLLNSYLVVVNELKTDLYSEDIIAFNPTDIISFNYTSTFDKVYGFCNSIDYVHGMISNGKNDNSIVLGFDSFKDNEKDFEYAEFLKYYQMVNKNVSIGVLDSCNKEVEPIYSMFFGHSLDKTDGDIIKEAVEKSTKVFVMCSKPGHKSSMIKNLIDIYGEKEFRRLCLGKNKIISFVDQKIMAKDFGFTKQYLLDFISLFDKNYNYKFFVGFMNNYFNGIYMGIYMMDQLCSLLFRFFKDKLISRHDLDYWLTAIKEKIKFQYNEDKIVFEELPDILSGIDNSYNFLVGNQK